LVKDTYIKVKKLGHGEFGLIRILWLISFEEYFKIVSQHFCYLTLWFRIWKLSCMQLTHFENACRNAALGAIQMICNTQERQSVTWSFCYFISNTYFEVKSDVWDQLDKALKDTFFLIHITIQKLKVLKFI